MRPYARSEQYYTIVESRVHLTWYQSYALNLVMSNKRLQKERSWASIKVKPMCTSMQENLNFWRDFFFSFRGQLTVKNNIIKQVDQLAVKNNIVKQMDQTFGCALLLLHMAPHANIDPLDRLAHPQVVLVRGVRGYTSFSI